MRSRWAFALTGRRRTVFLTGAFVGAACVVLAASQFCCDGRWRHVEPAPKQQQLQSNGTQSPQPQTVRRVAHLDRPPVARVCLTPQAIAQTNLSSAGAYRLYVDDRRETESDRPMPITAVTRAEGVWRVGSLTLPGNSLRLEPQGEAMVRWNGRPYRGLLQLLAVDAPGGQCRLIVVNNVGMEEYLCGVVACEMYRNWHGEALRAQAIAARTFATFYCLTAPQGSYCDLGANEGSQVYRGASEETEASRSAVRDTFGVVLTAGDAGAEGVFMAQYSACCGGVVNPARVIRNAPDLAPLNGGQADEDCRDCPRFRWQDVRISKADIHRVILSAYPDKASRLGGLDGVRVTEQTSYGRPVWLELLGKNKRFADKPETLVLRAEDLRLLLMASLPAAKNLNSMNCTIRDAGQWIVFADGQGWGHGVGMCQWGAQGKAVKGWDYRQILNFYYPGAKLMRLYDPT